MLLSEPSRTPYDLRFSLFGIPIRVHPLFWLAGLLLGRNSKSGPELLIWMLAFFLGILCHELGHALVMRRQGHFSWITLYCFGGLASCERSFRTGMYPEGWRQVAVSAAGPAAGFLLAAIVVAAVVASGHQITIEWGGDYGLNVYTTLVIGSPYLVRFINSFLFVTVIYGIFNLLPVYPLDGGQIVRELLLMKFGAEGIRTSLIISMLAAAALASYGALKLHDMWFALLFGVFAYSSYQTLDSYNNSRRW